LNVSLLEYFFLRQTHKEPTSSLPFILDPPWLVLLGCWAVDEAIALLSAAVSGRLLLGRDSAHFTTLGLGRIKKYIGQATTAIPFGYPGRLNNLPRICRPVDYIGKPS
jgi:hypothetical protein